MVGLSQARQDDVHAAVCAVETARRPVPASTFRALAEPTLRLVVEEELAAAGRVLVTVRGGYLSGYSDPIAARLAKEGTGVLPRECRAVLTLVLLRGVAIPRADGRVPRGVLWTDGIAVPREELRHSALSDTQIDEAVKILVRADVLQWRSGGLIPGPQFLRLTPAMMRHLFEQLVLLAEPEGAQAEALRRRDAGISWTVPEEGGQNGADDDNDNT